MAGEGQHHKGGREGGRKGRGSGSCGGESDDVDRCEPSAGIVMLATLKVELDLSSSG